jgi:hypothetical protein
MKTIWAPAAVGLGRRDHPLRMMPAGGGGGTLPDVAIATEPAQLLVYRFAPGGGFDGRFVGALERLEAGGALRVLDILVVVSDAATGSIVASEHRGGSASGFAGALVALRLDPASRERETRRALARPDGLAAELAATLAPGEAVAAVLIGHAWARTLEDAVRRTSGTPLLDTMVGHQALAALGDEILTAARARP